MHTVAQFLSLSNKIKLIQFPGLCLPNLLFFLYWVSDSRTFIGFFFVLKKKKITDLFGWMQKINWVSWEKKKNTVSKKKKRINFFTKGLWFWHIYLGFVLKITDLFGFECKNQMGFWRKLKRTNFYSKGL